MIFEIKKPITPSIRHLIRIKGKDLRKTPLLKKELIKKINNAGKNNSGKTTVFHKGGGVKQRYRKIKFIREGKTLGTVCSIEYDPCRTAFIASVFESKKENKFFYIIAPRNLEVGDVVKSGKKIEPRLGNSLPLYRIPAGTPVHNIATKLRKKGQISRAAGTFSIVRETIFNNTTLALSSGKLLKVYKKCYASIGSVSNNFHFLSQHGKAGNSRWMNKRPSVRGVAMNPIDHPHGGGEGKKSGISKSPWGKIT